MRSSYPGWFFRTLRIVRVEECPPYAAGHTRTGSNYSGCSPGSSRPVTGTRSGKKSPYSGSGPGRRNFPPARWSGRSRPQFIRIPRDNRCRPDRAGSGRRISRPDDLPGVRNIVHPRRKVLPEMPCPSPRFFSPGKTSGRATPAASTGQAGDTRHLPCLWQFTETRRCLLRQMSCPHSTGSP